MANNLFMKNLFLYLELFIYLFSLYVEGALLRKRFPQEKFTCSNSTITIEIMVPDSNPKLKHYLPQFCIGR